VNEQEAADFFSEQVDRLLRGETPPVPSGGDDLQGLLTLAKELSHARFQPSPAGQAAFQSQLGAWFGAMPEGTSPGPKTGRWNMMSGKLFVLILSIFITVVTAVATVVIAIVVVVHGVFSGTPRISTPIPETTSLSPTVVATSSLTSTVVPTGTLTPSATPLPGTIDTIEAITVVVTVDIQIDDLVPGLPPGGDEDHHDDHNGDFHDHNRGHGNDPDHHDEDNPGCCDD
jgi:hypothetical protein